MRREASASSGEDSGPTSGSALLVTCCRCGALHRPEDELAFDPLCEACRRSGVVGAWTVPVVEPLFQPLSDRAITDAVGETSPGNYTLGYLDGSGFTPFYVGRSDSDLGACLREWVGAPSRPRRHESSRHDAWWSHEPWRSSEPWRSRAGPLPGLGTRALGRIPVGIDTAYTHFAFRYAPSAIAAFERECRDYHELGGSADLDNPLHPQPPPDSPWACPVHGYAQ